MMELFNEEQLSNIANRIAEMLDESIDILGFEEREGMYRIFFVFDGNDNKGHRGTATFKCRKEKHQVVDFELYDLTGSGFKDTRKVIYANS